MFLVGLGINYNVIEIDYCKFIQVWSKDIFHHRLKCCQDISQSKRDCDELEFAISSIERCLRYVFFLDLNLPVS